jgi:hypothetical protein
MRLIEPTLVRDRAGSGRSCEEPFASLLGSQKVKLCEQRAGRHRPRIPATRGRVRMPPLENKAAPGGTRRLAGTTVPRLRTNAHQARAWTRPARLPDGEGGV